MSDSRTASPASPQTSHDGEELDCSAARTCGPDGFASDSGSRIAGDNGESAAVSQDR